MDSPRAGFTLSAALFRKKCGATSPIFSSKKLATFTYLLTQTPSRLIAILNRTPRSGVTRGSGEGWTAPDDTLQGVTPEGKIVAEFTKNSGH